MEIPGLNFNSEERSWRSGLKLVFALPLKEGPYSNE